MGMTGNELICTNVVDVIDGDVLSYELAVHQTLANVPEAIAIAFNSNHCLEQSFSVYLKLTVEQIQALVTHIITQATCALVATFMSTCSASNKETTSRTLNEIVGPQLVVLVDVALCYYLKLPNSRRSQISVASMQM